MQIYVFYIILWWDLKFKNNCVKKIFFLSFDSIVLKKNGNSLIYHDFRFTWNSICQTMFLGVIGNQ